MLLEYCEEGTLKDWLSQVGETITPSVMEQLNVFCLHVAKGMEHLHDIDVCDRMLLLRGLNQCIHFV